jgi:hypothetical protein
MSTHRQKHDHNPPSNNNNEALLCKTLGTLQSEQELAYMQIACAATLPDLENHKNSIAHNCVIVVCAYQITRSSTHKESKAKKLAS